MIFFGWSQCFAIVLFQIRLIFNLYRMIISTFSIANFIWFFFDIYALCCNTNGNQAVIYSLNIVTIWIDIIKIYTKIYNKRYFFYSQRFDGWIKSIFSSVVFTIDEMKFKISNGNKFYLSHLLPFQSTFNSCITCIYLYYKCVRLCARKWVCTF